MGTTIYLTGALHEDGLADSADGLGGGWGREQILTIMQDSRLGTYGAIALFLMLFSKFQVLSLMGAMLAVVMLVVGHALSRLSAVWLMATLVYVKPAGKAKPLATQVKPQHLVVATVFGLLPFLIIFALLMTDHHMPPAGVNFLLFTFVPVIAAWVWWRAKLIKKLGGYTGDTLGAMQQISELVFYLGGHNLSPKYQKPLWGYHPKRAFPNRQNAALLNGHPRPLGLYLKTRPIYDSVVMDCYKSHQM